MAKASTVRYGQQSILIEAVAGSGVFTAPCGLTSLTRTTNKETTTTNVPDCTNPDLAPWLEIDPVSNQMVLSGTGVLAQEAIPMWDAWDRAGDYRRARWYRDLLAANGGGYYEGDALLTTYTETASNHGRYTVNIAITYNGEPVWTPVA
jgi:hypothetical protein